MHAVGSLVRIIVNWAGRYISLIAQIVDPNYIRIYPSAQWRVLTPYSGLGIHYEIDLITIAAFGVLALIAISALAVFWFHPEGPRLFAVEDVADAPDSPGTARHRIVRTLDRTLGPILALAGCLLVAATVIAVLTDLPPRGRLKTLLVVLTVNLLTVVFVLMLCGLIAWVRSGLALIADLAGFWRITAHPLASTSYRPGVLAGIRTAISGTGSDSVVLVGHSQGSILAAWVAAGRDEARRKAGEHWPTHLHLVTCGCPLESLYAKFFPSEVDQRLFDEIAAGTQTWDNFWRSTDPIASAMRAGSSAQNTWLDDPRVSGRRRHAHSDYWIDPCQVATVNDLLVRQDAVAETE